MKKLTDAQKKVFALSSKLPKITNNHINWAVNNCLDSFCTLSRKSHICLECGNTWKEDTNYCSECEKEMRFIEMGKFHADAAYTAIFSVKDGYQVVRVLFVKKTLVKGKKSSSFGSEVMQHWIDSKGNIISLTKDTFNHTMCLDHWYLNSEFKIQSDSPRNQQRFRLNPLKIHPYAKILPEIIRNGYQGNTHDMLPQELFSTLLSNAKFETLFKAGEIDTCEYMLRFGTQKIDKYWSSLKICIRNNYKIEQLSDWFDYLDLLGFFNKDLSNSKYVCPSNLSHAHDRLVSKKRAVLKKMKIEELRQEIEASQMDYEKAKKSFFGLQFSKDDITIKFIESVQEFLDQGDLLNHCLFTNEYYKKNESLIFSASYKNETVETVEFSLDKMKVVQSRGLNNIPSDLNPQIVKIMKENIPTIINIYQNNNKAG